MTDNDGELMSVYPSLNDGDIDLNALSQAPGLSGEIFASSEPNGVDSSFVGGAPFTDVQQPDEIQKHDKTDDTETVKTQPSSSSGAKPRKKLWQCVYPGCTEPPKTHYNCHSHVWDAHVRHQLPPDHPLSQFVYKKLPDRNAVKGLCRTSKRVC